MARLGTTLRLLFLGASFLAVPACDSSAPSSETSTFADPDFRAREISGTARRGEDGVPGAEIHVAPGTLPTDANTIVADATADEVGFFRLKGYLPDIYDLFAKLPGGVGGRDDVLVYRGVATRAFEPQLEVAGRVLPRSWSGHVDVRFDEPVEADHAILFLANGTNVFGVTGDVANGLEVATQDFVDTATIHAIEYDPTKGVISASKYGSASVVTDASNAKTVTIHLDPITTFATTQLSYAIPAGFVPGTVDIRIAAVRTSDALLVSIPYGQSVTVPLMPFAYSYDLSAKRADGAVSDSGEITFDVRQPTVIALPDPPEVVAPAPNATVAVGDPLATVGVGVIEHVFEPVVAGSAGFRVIVASPSSTPVPDLSVVNELKATGAYLWTVRRFSGLSFAEALAGADVRRYQPMASAAPRTISVH